MSIQTDYIYTKQNHMYLFIFPTKNGMVSAVWVVLHVSDRFTEWNEGVHLCSDRSSK